MSVYLTNCTVCGIWAMLLNDCCSNLVDQEEDWLFIGPPIQPYTKCLYIKLCSGLCVYAYMYNILYNDTVLFSQDSNFNVWVGTKTTRHFKILWFPCSAVRRNEEAVAVGGGMCVLRCSSGQGGHSASLEPLKEGRKGVGCSRRQGTWLVWPSEGQWVRITPGRGGLRCSVCPCCWHKVSTLFPCHLHADPCSVVQLPIVPGEHPPVALGRGLERRLGPSLWPLQWFRARC